MDLARALEHAVAVAREAGRILLADFHRPGGPRGQGEKADADVEAERTIRERLLAAFPGWGFVGEETGRVTGEAGTPLWLVDPNDGTRDYLEGRRGSSVSIGLLAGGRPVLGVVLAYGYPDDRGDLFAWAEQCGPLQRNDRPVEVRASERLGPLDVVLVSSNGDLDPDGHFECTTPARYRTVSSIAHRLALVAAGEASAAASVYAPCAWDYAAGQALLRAAGANLVDQTGGEVGYAEDGSSQARWVVAGHPAVTAELARRPWESVSTRGRWPDDDSGRLRPGETVADCGVLSRAHGCLLGQIAGDSLGSLVELRSSTEIALAYPEGPLRLEDGGVWKTLAGQPTDDSEMALTLARSIVRSGAYSPEATLTAYRDWYRSAPFDIGNTTRAALHGYLIGNSQANGSLMRASPIGIFAHARSPASTAEIGCKDSALTHPHPVCTAAVTAFAVAVAHAVAHGQGPDAVFQAAVDSAKASGAPPAVVDTLLAAKDSPPVCDRENPGWVLIALRNAFFELLHARSVEEGVVRTVRRGGDTDTNAAVTGALMGAVYGRDAVPSQWRRMVLSCRPHSVRAKHPRPMAYWPVDVLELAERLLVAGRSEKYR